MRICTFSGSTVAWGGVRGGAVADDTSTISSSGRSGVGGVCIEHFLLDRELVACLRAHGLSVWTSCSAADVSGISSTTATVMDIPRAIRLVRKPSGNGARDGAAWHTLAKPEIIVGRGPRGHGARMACLTDCGCDERPAARIVEHAGRTHIAPRDSFVNGTPDRQVGGDRQGAGHRTGGVAGKTALFCLRARDGIAELFRVVRPGGTVAFTVWTQSGGLLGALGPLAAVAGDGLREEARAMVVELVGGASGPVRLSAGCLVAVAQRPQTSA